MNEHISKFKGVLVLVGVLLAIFLALKSWEVVDSIKRPDFSRPSITVTGEGKVFARPDIGQVNLAVSIEAKTVEEAQRQATEITNRIFAVLKEKGVLEKDVKTTNYSINQEYDFPDGRRVFTGYRVSQNFQVKIRDLSKAGEILAAASNAGANQIGGLSFTTEDPSALRDQARAEAIEDAERKAQELSEKLGVKLGKIIGFNEFGGPGPIPVFFEGRASGMGGDFSVPEIPTGENEINLQVNVTYQIK